MSREFQSHIVRIVEIKSANFAEIISSTTLCYRGRLEIPSERGDTIALRHMRENAPRCEINAATGWREEIAWEIGKNPLVPSFDRTPLSFVCVLTYSSFDLFRET